MTLSSGRVGSTAAASVIVAPPSLASIASSERERKLPTVASVMVIELGMSFRLDAAGHDHAMPARGLLLEEGGDLLRCAADRRQRELAPAPHHLGVAQDFRERPRQLVRDV